MNLETIRLKKTQILAEAARYGVANVRVFGSVARSEATQNSDVDFLVTALPGTGLLKLAGFYNAVSKLLGCKVDVATDGKKLNSDQDFIQHALKDAVLL